MADAQTQAASGMDALSPVARETAQDRVYRQLRSALIVGAFDAGETFLVGDVASRMSVSSMPVREALARLVSERALEAMANRRVRVPLLSRERARDIARSRSLIEGELASCAMARLTPADIDELESMTMRYEATREAGAIAKMNHAFHFRIYQAASSPVLLSFAESLWMQAGPFVRAAARLHEPATDKAATVHHHGIVSAIASGNAPRLVAELTADISQAFDILERCDSADWASQEIVAHV